MNPEIESEEVLRKRLQSRSLPVLLVQIGICSAIFWAVFGANLRHSWDLHRLNRALNATAHPANSRLVSQGQEVGLLIRNGDHCDFFVGELRSFRGTQSGIKKFYSQSKIWNPLNNTSQPLEIMFLQNGKIPASKQEYLPSGFDSVSRGSKSPLNTKQHYYLLYFFDVGYDADFDWRCL